LLRADYQSLTLSLSTFKKMFKGHKMIAKKTKKTNTKTATKVTTQPKKQGNGALNLFFSLMGVVVVAGTLTALFVPTLAKADTITKSGKGTFITEDFSCKVALADFAELQRVLEITPRSDFKYSIFLSQYETVSKALSNHTECKGVNNGK